MLKIEVTPIWRTGSATFFRFTALEAFLELDPHPDMDNGLTVIVMNFRFSFIWKKGIYHD